jgi:REP element-mobilizing transposase RayT
MDVSRRGDHRVALRVARRAQTTGKRRSIRLPSYDYSTPGAYFVTICAQGHRPIFRSERFKSLLQRAWRWLPERFPSIELDEFVVMPDHVHFVLHIREPGATADPSVPSLGTLVGAFKTFAAKAINGARGTRGRTVWQRGYYEHIARDESELERIREYIRYNPLKAHQHLSEDVSEAWE